MAKSNEPRLELPPGDENSVAIRDETGSGEGYLYRFRDLVGERADWVRQIVVDSQLFLSSPARFNDPFDCQARFQVSDPAALKAVVKARATALAYKAGMPRRERRQLVRGKVRPDKLLRDTLRDTQKSIHQDIRVLSLSATHESILMWSHYTYGHQGVCLQFRLEADRGFFAGSQPVQYSKELPIPEVFGDPMDQVDKLLLTKALDWEYEREWRIIHTDGVNVVHFPPQLLTGLIMGANISREHVKLVRDWAAKRADPIAIYQAARDTKAFALTFDRVA